jgi:hypothetical protein
MAGDWIKLTHAVLDKPEIRKTARMLDVKHGQALELYLRWWVWLDVNSVDGLVDGLVDQDVDDLLRCPGFSACMREVGWLTTDEASGKLRVSGFDSHNGETSKKRALKNKAQAQWRANVDARVDENVDQQRSTKASTREEKRRVLKTRSVIPEGFSRFWAAWPRNPRKAAKPQCLARWVSANLEGRASEVVAHVEACKRSSDWIKDGGSYIPAPLVYLRQDRFDAPTESASDDPQAWRRAL